MRKIPAQPRLFASDAVPSRFTHHLFSHGQVCNDAERLSLEQRYEKLFVADDRFNRKIVSFQGNKGELLHSWLKYREGFSSVLVETLIQDFDLKPGDRLLDPFAGSATALLVAKTFGLDATGIDILPNCHLAWDAKSRFAEYSVTELEGILSQIKDSEPAQATREFPHIAITESAFPPKTENDIMWYTDFLLNLPISDDAKILMRLIIASILENVSYTRKDGQYLRWDHRAEKLISRNNIRNNQGKKTIKGIDKGTLPGVKEALIQVLSEVIEDIRILQVQFTKNSSDQELLRGNALEVLTTLPDNTFSAVITSPPYANRYDYTRTYALELAYLGFGDGIAKLRQELLSCTVESRSKIKRLEHLYETIGQAERYHSITATFNNNPVVKEIDSALQLRWDRGDMNNRGVLRMIHQYFEELTFIFAELHRTCRPGSKIAFVNDNVRYGGEIIPVDTITTSLAESLGFEPERIIVLAQKKGNSSQQMEKFGREELRKCITIWRKP